MQLIESDVRIQFEVLDTKMELDQDLTELYLKPEKSNARIYSKRLSGMELFHNIYTFVVLRRCGA